jgi:hypothetical protein
MFGLFKRRAKTAAPVAESPAALGWAAIEKAFERLYPGQKPRHWTHDGVMRMHDLKNPPENPFDGVNIYDGGSFWHYVSLGMSDLYERVSKDAWSGFGYEFTFRLGKEADQDQEPPLWPINLMGSLARAAFTGSNFAHGHTVKIGPIDGRAETKLTALLLVTDPGFGPQETPTGRMGFLQLVGVEAETRERAVEVGMDEVIGELRKQNPELITRT